MYHPAPGPEGLPARLKRYDGNLVFKGFLPRPSPPTLPWSDLSASQTELAQSFALLFLDLDQFRFARGSHLRNVNDEAISAYRDCLLDSIKQALHTHLRAEDLVSQISATEFIIAVRSAPLEKVTQVASRLAQLLNQPIRLEDHLFQVSCNIGISFYPEDGPDTDALIQKANLAMQEAKANVAWAVRLHPSEASHAIRRRILIEQALTHPDLPRQLEMKYQPQWDCIRDRLYGFEGLVRWHHPHLGEISPVEFIPIAEELGCIHRITNLALTESLRFTRDLSEKYGVSLRPSVNVSAQEFKEFRRLFSIIDQQLQHFQIPGNFLTIELTEHVFLQPSDQIITHMTRLRDRGICIALDDFGTGFSCLNYLLDLPLNTLKIDRAFVQNINQDQRRRGVVQAIISMARSLNMRCIAEGIETSAELQCLQNFGCALIQGYIVSPALSEADFLSFLQQFSPHSLSSP